MFIRTCSSVVSSGALIRQGSGDHNPPGPLKIKNMTTLESYKREATKIFYLSVDRDIDLWQGGGYYYSGAYKNIYFQID